MKGAVKRSGIIRERHTKDDPAVIYTENKKQKLPPLEEEEFESKVCIMTGLSSLFPNCILCNLSLNREYYLVLQDLEARAYKITKRPYPDKASFAFVYDAWSKDYRTLLKTDLLQMIDINYIYDHFSPNGKVLCQINKRRLCPHLFFCSTQSFDGKKRCWDVIVVYLCSQIFEKFPITWPRHKLLSICKILTHHANFFTRSLHSFFRLR